jgi:hypothetical protein
MAIKICWLMSIKYSSCLKIQKKIISLLLKPIQEEYSQKIYLFQLDN